MSELDRLDALGQADLVRKGEVRPSELLERAIARLERVNEEARPWRDRRPPIAAV